MHTFNGCIIYLNVRAKFNNGEYELINVLVIIWAHIIMFPKVIYNGCN